MKNTRFSLSPLATVMTMMITLPAFAQAEDGHEGHQNSVATLDDPSVMVVTAPAISPLTIVTSPKTPRQPVPASDGSDYLKTIPGFLKSVTAEPMAIRFFAVCSVRVCAF